jgi:hypothetical protein
MTYKKNLVAVLKYGGKVLREQHDRIELPFGAEYSILLKNLDSVRIQARIHIDGQDATEGTWLVIAPNSSIEIERFIKADNLDAGNRFKFIERTGDIEEARGIKADDGLIRIEFKKEKVVPAPIHVPFVIHDPVYVPSYPYSPWRYDWQHNYTVCDSSHSGALNSGDGILRSSSLGSHSKLGSIRAANASGSFASNSMSVVPPVIDNEAGITVPGSESQQKFSNVAWFATEDQSEVIVLRLIGRHDCQLVKVPVTVDIRTVCQTCKKRSKSDSKFCSRCGTSLVII